MSVHGLSLLLPIRDGSSDAVDIPDVFEQEKGMNGDDQPSVKPLLLWCQNLPSLDPLVLYLV